MVHHPHPWYWIPAPRRQRVGDPAGDSRVDVRDKVFLEKEKRQPDETRGCAAFFLHMTRTRWHGNHEYTCAQRDSSYPIQMSAWGSFECSQRLTRKSKTKTKAVVLRAHVPPHPRPGRYRFDHKPTPSAAQGSRKRRHPAEPTPDAPEAQRTKLERANTQEAVEALHAISNGDGGHSKNRHDDLDEGGQAGGGDGRCRAGGERGVQLSGGGETPPPSMVTEVLRDAMCGLCSELLLDAGVLPCSHSFCRMCWADHVEEKGTT